MYYANTRTVLDTLVASGTASAMHLVIQDLIAGSFTSSYFTMLSSVIEGPTVPPLNKLCSNFFNEQKKKMKVKARERVN